MIVSIIFTIAIIIGIVAAAKYIDSSYEDFKGYMDTQNTNNDR